MARTIKFEITTPEKKVYSEDVEQITIPTLEGEITVLPGHIPLVAALRAGELKVIKNKEEIPMAVSGGFIEITPEKVVVLADSAEHAEEIDEKRAEEAKARAAKLMTEKKFDAEEFAVLSAKIEKELARLHVAKKRKHRYTPGSTITQ